MATDNTPPRLKLHRDDRDHHRDHAHRHQLRDRELLRDDDRRGAGARSSAPTPIREEQHKAELAAFTSAALPIDKAIAEISRGDRPAAITPEQSDGPRSDDRLEQAAEAGSRAAAARRSAGSCAVDAMPTAAQRLAG